MEALKKKKLEDYLAENLPVTEERIAEPMHPACRVCVVIPSYNERDYILKPLESLALQKNTPPEMYEVIIVVNNPGSPPAKKREQTDEEYNSKVESYRQAVENNRETLNLIKYINSDIDKADIQLNSKEEEIIKKIRQSGLKVFSIDKSSKGKTLPSDDANVGGARNRGVAEAIARFYYQLGKNGIIAHTDADTWMDEFYIQNLVEFFKKNPQVIGIAGLDEDTLEDPWDSQAMKDFLMGYTTALYIPMLHHLFLKYHQEPVVNFIGSNMATRAYETAMVGGISKLAGAEDTALAQELKKIGIIARAPDVVNFPLLRYSTRTTTGKGLRMQKCYDDEDQKGKIEVRSIESAYYISQLYNKLQDAKTNHQTSPEDLSKILVFDDEALLDNEELIRFSQNIHQLETSLLYLLNKDLRALAEKICDKIDNKLKPIPLDEAVAVLISTYCMNDNLKKKFQTIKTKMIQQRNEDMASIQFILDKIFQDPQPSQDIHILSERITAILENNKSILSSHMFKRHRIKRIAEFISISATKEEALELIKINFMKYLVTPEKNSELSVFFDLEVLPKVLDEAAEG